MRSCPICGKAFEPKRKNQPTCGDDECRLEWRHAYCRNYMDGRRAYQREYNRIWMAKYRAKQKTKGEETEKVDTLIGLNYAERQKQKTLSMVEKIEL